jgi:hypothetical protein
MVLAPVNSVFRSLLGIPSAVIYNAMACRVFRHLRLGTVADYDASTSVGGHTVNFTRPTVVPISQRSRTLEDSNEPDRAIKIEVRKTTRPTAHPT